MIEKKLYIEFNKLSDDQVQILGDVIGDAITIEINNLKCWHYNVRFFDKDKRVMHYLKSNEKDGTNTTLEKMKKRLEKEIKKCLANEREII